MFDLSGKYVWGGWGVSLPEEYEFSRDLRLSKEKKKLSPLDYQWFSHTLIHYVASMRI